MSYSPSWAHQDAAGHVLAGQPVRAIDVNELQDAINRRLKVMFDPRAPLAAWPLNFAVAAGQPISAGAALSVRSGLEMLVPEWSYFVHDAGWDQLSLWAMWLNPQPGPDEDLLIVPDGRPPGPGEVGFFAKLTGGTGWSGGIASSLAAAAQVNEPRDAAALLSRGRYIFRVGDGGSAKASKALPGGLWYPPAVAKDNSGEMHSWFGGRQWLWPSDGAGGWFGVRGQSVAVRGAKFRLMPAGADVSLTLHHCLRNVNPSNFSWEQYDAASGAGWGSPGGTGAGDAEPIASLALTDNAWTEHQGAGLVAMVQRMADGIEEPTFMLTPDSPTGWGSYPTHLQVELIVDFDLDGPPV